MTSQWKMKTKIGTLFLLASKDGLLGIYWTKQSEPLCSSLKNKTPEARMLAQAVLELEEYFSGRRKNFKVPLDFRGTAFQKQVWTQLCKIPFGQTQSYKDIAMKIKNPKAVRAVGSANGKNPLCIIVPCHRVIAADGSIGGYSGGLSIKRKLLALEGILAS